MSCEYCNIVYRLERSAMGISLPFSRLLFLSLVFHEDTRPTAGLFSQRRSRRSTHASNWDVDVNVRVTYLLESTDRISQDTCLSGRRPAGPVDKAQKVERN